MLKLYIFNVDIRKRTYYMVKNVVTKISKNVEL